MQPRRSFLLIHSPLVGPATWRPVARSLRGRGHLVAAPRIRPAVEVDPPYLIRAIEDAVAAVDGLPDDPVLVAHSGAGPWLPAIGRALGRRGRRPSAYLFVDAGVPTDGSSAIEAGPADFRALLGRLDDEVEVPPWSDWWDSSAMADLVPDGERRAALLDECRPLPMALFREPRPIPDGWPDAPCGYLTFTYLDDAAEAVARGWPTYRIDGGHLHLVNEPETVATALLEMLRDLAVGT